MRTRPRGLGRHAPGAATVERPDRPESGGASSRAGSLPGACSQLWSDSLGRAATRGGQMLLVSVVVVALVWLLTRLSVVTIPLVRALIFAAASAS